MLIDWFTVGAQVINFVILVWLMKRFLYKPILNAIDAREQRIAAELADAEAKRAEAQKERDEFEHKNEDFDRQRAGRLQQATDRGKSRAAAPPRRSAEGGRRRACRSPGKDADRRPQPQSSHRSRGPSKKCLPLRARHWRISPRQPWRNA